MTEFFRFDRKTIEGPSHDHKRTMTAFSCFVAEIFAEIKQFIKSRSRADIHDASVIFRSFRSKTVRTIFLQLVRKIAAGDKDGFSIQSIARFLDQHTQFIMLRQIQTGKTDPDDPALLVLLTDEPQRNHRPMIQIRISFTQYSGGKTFLIAQITKQIDQLRVIFFFESDLRSTETGKIS